MEPLINEIMTAAKAAGVLGSMTFLWLWLRAEKKVEALQERNEALIERVFAVLTDTKDALRELRAMFGGRNNGAQ